MSYSLREYHELDVQLSNFQIRYTDALFIYVKMALNDQEGSDVNIPIS